MRNLLTIFLLTFMATLSAFASDDKFALARAEMVQEIETMVRTTRGYLGKDELDQRVIAALIKVPRHNFVPVALQDFAYLNQPLPIGYEQTISQPYIVAIMTDLLGVFEGGRVLEVGTGSGYQAALLGELCESVYSIEIIEPLGRKTKQLLEELGYNNVHVRTADGYLGWPDEAPFDGIIVTAAAPEVPPPLLDQLRPGGRLIIPVNHRHWSQELLLIEKDANGAISRQNILPVRFVPLTRKE
jgi:protein-L-isoaspartate(D-aspartate) O-methyltransferase